MFLVLFKPSDRGKYARYIVPEYFVKIKKRFEKYLPLIHNMNFVNNWWH